jgi:simple sugar transport system substrate-binding protein
LLSFATFSLVLAACGGDDDDNAGSSTGSAEATGGGTASATESSAASETGVSASASASESSTAASSTAGGSDTVTAEQGTDLTFHMITHSDDGPFWSVVHRGMDAACEDLGVTCVWMASNNDPGKQESLIEQAVSEGSDGIASALASPDQLIPPLQAAVAAGIPVITLNSGSNDYKSIGASRMSVRPRRSPERAGDRFNELGATKILCGRQEESNGARRALRRPRRNLQG